MAALGRALIAAGIVASVAAVVWRGGAGRSSRRSSITAVTPLVGASGASASAKSELPSPACTPDDPCLAIVIDDIGRTLPPLERLLELELPLTFAVLPHALHTARSVERLRAAGREYLLHLPMQPRDPRAITDEPLVLHRGAPLELIVRDCLRRVPGAVGVNNHMGSALSEHRESLWRVFGQLQLERPDLLVLDSRTSADSRICAVAGERGLPCAGRDVFLDDPRDTATVTDRLDESARLAETRGWAIAIGHPTSTTIAALEKFGRQRAERNQGEPQRRAGRHDNRYRRVVSLSRVIAVVANGA